MFATCGQGQKSEANAAKLNKEYPLDTFLQKSELPQMRARLDLQRGNAGKAIEELRPAEWAQLGFVELGVPAYLRGLAYLQNKQGAEAAAEFQKILDHRGALGPWPYWALAKLGLGRAFALTGDPAKARTAYQDFFTLWKDADPGPPHPEGSQGGVLEAAVAGRIPPHRLRFSDRSRKQATHSQRFLRGWLSGYLILLPQSSCSTSPGTSGGAGGVMVGSSSGPRVEFLGMAKQTAQLPAECFERPEMQFIMEVDLFPECAPPRCPRARR